MKRKRKFRTKESSLGQKLAGASEFPKDVVLGQPIVTVLGQTELTVENYRGILEYTETEIRLQTKTGQIRMAGQHLCVEYYTGDDMKITGQIDRIEYQS